MYSTEERLILNSSLCCNGDMRHYEIRKRERESVCACVRARMYVFVCMYVCVVYVCMCIKSLSTLHSYFNPLLEAEKVA